MRSVGKLLYGAVALVLVLWLGVFAWTQFRHLRASKAAGSALAGRRANILTAETRGRKVYPLSVIPGGIYSSEELARSRRIDSVVARHYAGFGNSVSVRKTVQDTYMYISYRKNDEVYWTKTKHRIPRGEYVVTDGKSFARARCGNRLSALPQEPVMNAGEPGEDRLDKPEAPGDMYLASLNPSAGDPSFSIPASADEEPVLDAISSAPKPAAASPGSPFAGNAGSGAFPMGGGFGGTPYVAQRNRTSNPSSSSSAGVPGTQSVPIGNSTEGGMTAAVVMIPTPEPSGLALLIGGGASLMLGLLALRGRDG